MRSVIVLALVGLGGGAASAREAGRPVVLECTAPDSRTETAGGLMLMCRMDTRTIALLIRASDTMDPFDAAAPSGRLMNPFDGIPDLYVDPFERGRFAVSRLARELVDPFDVPVDAGADPDRAAVQAR